MSNVHAPPAYLVEVVRCVVSVRGSTHLTHVAISLGKSSITLTTQSMRVNLKLLYFSSSPRGKAHSKQVQRKRSESSR